MNFHKGTGMLAQKYKYNPLDDVECMFANQTHTTERRNSNEIVVEVSGKWDNMLLFFAWEENMNCLHISCLLNLEPANVNLPSIFELLALLNEDLWVGYFSYWEEMKMPVFKSVPLEKVMAMENDLYYYVRKSKGIWK